MLELITKYKSNKRKKGKQIERKSKASTPSSDTVAHRMQQQGQLYEGLTTTGPRAPCRCW